MAAAARPDQLSSSQNTIEKDRSILAKLFRLELKKEDLANVHNFDEYLKKMSEIFIDIVIEDVNEEEDSRKLLSGDVETIKEILEDIKLVTYPAKIVFMRFPVHNNLTFEKRDTKKFQDQEKIQKDIIETDFEHIIGLVSSKKCNILDYNYFGAITNLYEFYLPNYYNNLIKPTLEELNKHFSIISEIIKSIKSLKEKQSKGSELSQTDLETLKTNITKLFKCVYISASFYMIFERVKNRFNAIDTFIKQMCNIPNITIRNENIRTMNTITNLKAKTNPFQKINETKREVEFRLKLINLLMIKNQQEFFKTPKQNQFISNIKYFLKYIYLGTDLLGKNIKKNELSQKFAEAINEFFHEKEEELLRKEELKKQRAEEKRLALEQYKREVENQRRKNTQNSRLKSTQNKTKKNTGVSARAGTFDSDFASTSASTGANANTSDSTGANASAFTGVNANANASVSVNSHESNKPNLSLRKMLHLPHIGKGIRNLLGVRKKKMVV